MEDLEKKYPILTYFKYKHLPSHLQEVSKLFSVLAYKIAEQSGMNPETSAGLRKLLESKDCAVRAMIK